MTLRRDQKGRRIPGGTGLGNLRTSVNVKPNRFSATTEAYREAGRTIIQFDEYSDQLNPDT